MKELNYFNRISKYTNGELTQSERQTFENELLFNSDLYEEYQIYLQVQKQFQDPDLIEFGQLINEVSKNHKKKHRKNKNLLKGFVTTKILLYLTILTLLALFFWLYFGLR